MTHLTLFRQVLMLTLTFRKGWCEEAIAVVRRAVLKLVFGPVVTGIQVERLWDNNLPVEIVAITNISE